MKRYIVELTEDERASLEDLIARGRVRADRVKRARILLLADAGLTDEEIVAEVGAGIATVERTRCACVVEGLVAAVERKPQARSRSGKLDGAAEARLVHLACSAPPEGRARWTLRMLATQLVLLEVVESVSYETVRQVLKKTSSSPGARGDSASRRRRMRPSLPRWRTSLTSTIGHTIPSTPSSA
jgi:Homeodomain-like domain